MGQRLVRKLCSACKIPRILGKDELEGLFDFLPEGKDLLEGKTLYAPVGCSQCDNSGFVGRIGIREILETTPGIRELIVARASAQDIKAAAVHGGMMTMFVDGIKKASEGLTTIEEILRIIHE
jgi:type II secretory ATPase GspE/PulE/Tfp pilus assembly ATPase PilB-like protein